MTRVKKTHSGAADKLKALSDLLDRVAAPDFTQERKELRSYRLELSQDPVSEGLESFNEKFAEAQALKDRVGTMLQASHEAFAEHANLLSRAKTLLERVQNSARLREEVLELKNQQLREAATAKATMKYAALVNRITRRVDSIKLFQKVCHEVYDNLKSANENLSRQVTVVQLMLETGELTRRKLSTK